MTLDADKGALVRQLFRLLDAKRNGVLGPEELEIFTHHMGNIEPNKRENYNHLSQTRSVHEGRWTVEDFSTLCLAALEKHGEKVFGGLIKGLIETREDEKLQNKLMWQMKAVGIDVRCQTSFPLAYILCLVVLFAVRLPDEM